MSFISMGFVIFAAFAIITFFKLPPRFRNFFLLIASYYFYSQWNANYLWLILFSTIVDYVAGILIFRTSALDVRRRLLLLLSVLTNLGVLFTFKYYNFFIDSFRELLVSLGLTIHPGFGAIDVLLPVGISFYTFQSMSYTIDVFRGKLEPERNIVVFATYVAFFPQLVAGPIERATHLIPQFHQAHKPNLDRIVYGLRQVLWGAFKKVVIADRLAVVVNAVFADPQSYSGIWLLIASIFFSFQIYCDFSGYSDIAIGTARIMGFELMQNFRQPYFSRSLREFWRRWHISLSTWFRDYVYVPLGGNRVNRTRLYLNLLIVFVVSGLWHGAAWTFVIWGVIHGLYMVIETYLAGRYELGVTRRISSWLNNMLAVTWVFTVVTIAFVFFRAESLQDALYIITHFFKTDGEANGYLILGTNEMERAFELIFSIISILFLFVVDLLFERTDLFRKIDRTSVAVRWLVYQGLFWGVLFGYGRYNLSLPSEFIYFQF